MNVLVISFWQVYNTVPNAGRQSSLGSRLVRQTAGRKGPRRASSAQAAGTVARGLDHADRLVAHHGADRRADRHALLVLALVEVVAGEHVAQLVVGEADEHPREALHSRQNLEAHLGEELAGDRHQLRVPQAQVEGFADDPSL